MKDRLSWGEFFLWVAWRRIHGPIAIQLRSDWHAASICQAFVGGSLDDHRIKFRYDTIDQLQTKEYNEKLVEKIKCKFGIKNKNFRTQIVTRNIKALKNGNDIDDTIQDNGGDG